MEKEILLLIVGASIALFSAWVKSWIESESKISNEIFNQRLICLNRIWVSFYEVKEIYGGKISLGHEKWLKSNFEQALEKLNSFRRSIDESQIILGSEIVECFRAIDTYLFVLLHEESQRPSEYISDINTLLEEASAAINKNMNARLYRIKLQLKT